MLPLNPSPTLPANIAIKNQNLRPEYLTVRRVIGAAFDGIKCLCRRTETWPLNLDCSRWARGAEQTYHCRVCLRAVGISAGGLDCSESAGRQSVEIWNARSRPSAVVV